MNLKSKAAQGKVVPSLSFQTIQKKLIARMCKQGGKCFSGYLQKSQNSSQLPPILLSNPLNNNK